MQEFNAKLKITLAIDAMGGDKAPEMVVEGAAIALQRYQDIKFIFYGNQAQLKPLLAKYDLGEDIASIHHTTEIITNETKPSAALRNSSNSSMRQAIEAVKTGIADAVVSAGNTGAYMALTKFTLRTLPGIDRPAIAAPMPTLTGRCVMLDLGANVESTPEQLIQFALMGEVFARDVLKLPSPAVGLLNIGAEVLKGGSTLIAAHQELREGGWVNNFHGFVEGNDILSGTVEVVITDGFSGNIALKATEGACKYFAVAIKDLYSNSLRGKIGYFLVRKGLNKIRNTLDPRRYNGAIFLGLNGVAVKSHGGTDAIGYSYAIGVAINMAKFGVNDHIRQELAKCMKSDIPMTTEHNQGKNDSGSNHEFQQAAYGT